MHREFDPADRPFDQPSNAPTYFVTAVVGGFLLADVWPPVAAWLAGLGIDVPTWAAREVFGVRFALFAAVIGGARSLAASVEKLPTRLGADFAVALACVAAILIGEPVVAAEVVAIGLAGECLEAITFDRARRGVRAFAELFPLRTWVVRDGVEVRVFTTEVVVGDILAVKPGGKIPVDGVVVSGQSTLDTAALTGESLPREANPGDAVLAGGVNQLGTLLIRAAKVGADTVAGRVIDLTAAALKEKAPLERHADALARRFLPAVLVLAAAAFAVNVFALAGPFAKAESRLNTGPTVRAAAYPALAVLVVACPCPLVLATPAAVLAAVGRLAGTGVLVKGGAALERLAGVTAFAFDKTGTLTEGVFEIGDVVAFGGVTRDEILRAAAAAEAGSEHPLARAILSNVGGNPAPAANFRAHPGGGVTATVMGAAVVVGTARFLEENGVALPPEAIAAAAALDAAGQSAMFVARGGVAVGVIGAKDRVRPQAAGVLADLADLGIAPIVLLTGDRPAAAAAVAGQLPFTAVYADLLPARKAEILADIPGRAAFVGDGVNDAPALARAAVGIAVGNATDIAAEAGDVILMGDPLGPLPLLVRLSRETVAVIRQNIIWFGFGVNLVGVVGTGFVWPLVATGPGWNEQAPLAGVIYHQLGSLLVLLNSMRLLAFERTPKLPPAARRAAAWFTPAALDDAFHDLGHHWKRGLAAAGILAVGYWAASGITGIDAAEVGVVRRFGNPGDLLRPGLHVRWPYPIEEVTKLAPGEVRTVTIGFRVLSDEKQQLLKAAKSSQDKLRRPGDARPADLTWAGAHADGVVRAADESVMATGDGNLVEVLATVRYVVADPADYLFGTADPDALIRSAAEGVLRELAAGQAFLDLLTANRGAFELAAEVRLRVRLGAVAEGRLGVRVTGLTVHDLHPPAEVVSAYHDVASAIQARDRTINEAEADATRTRRRAEEEALRIVRRADADAAKKRTDAEASRDAFLAWHAARTTLTADEEKAAAAAPDPAKARADRLAVKRALTEFRLTLAATTAILAGRDKVLIDADDLPGRRQLFFADPEAGKLPPWLLRPPAGEKEP